MGNMKPNWQKNFKDKETAVAHIFDLLAQNPGVVGMYGTLDVIYGGRYITIKPPKKKKKE